MRFAVALLLAVLASQSVWAAADETWLQNPRSPCAATSVAEFRACLKPGTDISVAAGIYDMHGDIPVTESDITITCQEATFRNGAVRLKRSRIAIFGCRFEPGVPPPGKADNWDGLAVEGPVKRCSRRVEDIIIRNNSIIGGTDETLQLWSTSGQCTGRITIERNIIGDALHNAGHSKGSHGYCLIVGHDIYDVLVRENLFINCEGRNPRLSEGSSARVENNWVHNAGWGAIYMEGPHGDPGHHEIVGNLLTSGPNSPARWHLGHTPRNVVTPGTVACLADNRFEGAQPWDPDVKNLDVVTGCAPRYPATEVEAHILRLVGPPKRQINDWRLLAEAILRTGKHRDVPWPMDKR